MSPNREKLIESIHQLSGDRPIAEADVTRVALTLSTRFAQSGMTIDQIEMEVRQALHRPKPNTPMS